MKASEITLDLARRAFELGDFGRCERYCQTLIGRTDAAPMAETEVLRGRSMLTGEGRAGDALAAFQQAMIADAGSVAAHEGVVEAYLRLGQIDAASRALGELASIDPNSSSLQRFTRVMEFVGGGTQGHMDSDDLLLIGRAFNGVRRFDAALEILQPLSAGDGDPCDALVAVTRTYGGLGRIDDILAALRRLRDAVYRSPPYRRHRYLKEIELLTRSLDQVRPDHPLTIALLGSVVIEEAQTFGEGVRLLNRAEAMAPDLPDLYLGAGIGCLSSGDIQGALSHFERAAAGMPEFAEPPSRLQLAKAVAEPPDREAAPDGLTASELSDLAEALAAANRYGAAQAAAEVASATAPDVPEYARLHAALLSTFGRSEAALDVALGCRETIPDDPSINLEVATNLLSLGRLEEAWSLYDHRLEFWRRDTAERSFPMPQWDGEDLNDRTLLVWREEGIGDEMRFASILRDLRDSANFRLVVECGHRLRTLFERSFPGIEFRDENPAGGDFGEFDYHLPIMSLVRFFRRSLNEFPAEGAYLKPDPARVDRWLARLSEIGPQPKIGIGWRSLSKSWRKAPLLTRLEDWDRITGRSDLIIVNLQCEDVDDEITAATRRLGRDIHRFDDVAIKNDIEVAKDDSMLLNNLAWAMLTEKGYAEQYDELAFEMSKQSPTR